MRAASAPDFRAAVSNRESVRTCTPPQSGPRQRVPSVEASQTVKKLKQRLTGPDRPAASHRGEHRGKGQADVPAEQPSSRTRARLPYPYAHPCGSRNRLGPSSQGPRQADRLKRFQRCYRSSTSSRLRLSSVGRSSVDAVPGLAPSWSISWTAAPGPTRRSPIRAAPASGSSSPKPSGTL